MTQLPSKPSHQTPIPTHHQLSSPKRVRIRGPGAPQPYWQLVPPTATRVYHLLKASLCKVPPYDLDADPSNFELYLQGDPLLPHESISIIRDGDQLEIRHKQGLLPYPKINPLVTHMSAPSPPQPTNLDEVQSNSTSSSSSSASSSSSDSDSSNDDDSESDENKSFPKPIRTIPTVTPSSDSEPSFSPPCSTRILSAASKRRRNFRNRRRIKRRRLEHANKQTSSPSSTEHDETGPPKSETAGQHMNGSDNPKTISKESKSSAKRSAQVEDVRLQTPSEIPSTPGEQRIVEMDPLQPDDMGTNHVTRSKPFSSRLRVAGDDKTESEIRSPDIQVELEGEIAEIEHQTKDVSPVKEREEVMLSKKAERSVSETPIIEEVHVADKSISSGLTEREDKEKSPSFQQIENTNHAEGTEAKQQSNTAVKGGSRIPQIATDDNATPTSHPSENAETHENEDFVATQSKTKKILAEAKANALAELTSALASEPNPTDITSTQSREEIDKETSKSLELDSAPVTENKVKNRRKSRTKRRRSSEKVIPGSNVEAPQIVQAKLKATHEASLDVSRWPDLKDKYPNQEPEAPELNPGENDDANMEDVENGLSKNPTASDLNQSNAETEKEATEETENRHLPANIRYFLEEEQYNESSFLGLNIDIHHDAAACAIKELPENNDVHADVELPSNDANEKQNIVLMARVKLDKFPLGDEENEIDITKDTHGYKLKELSKSKVVFKDASSMIRNLLETDANPETIPTATKATLNESPKTPVQDDEKAQLPVSPSSPPTAWKVSGGIVNFVEANGQKRKSEKTSQHRLDENAVSTETSQPDSTLPKEVVSELLNSAPPTMDEKEILGAKYPDDSRSPKPTPFSSLSSDNRTSSPIREDDRHVEQMDVIKPEVKQPLQDPQDLQGPQELTPKTGSEADLELRNGVTSPKGDEAAPSPSLEDSADRSIPEIRFSSTDFRTCLYTTLVETSNVLDQLYRSR